jgi:superfamily I DNA/RNA helicase
MSNSALYLRAAEDLQENREQWGAYNSTGHCAVLAGPGSGKTKVLTIKLARMLAEDVAEPRGIACITYNNECARELEQRLAALGVESRDRVFIGTVHSFALTQIILPYARTAQIDLPEPFRVATQTQQRSAFDRAFRTVIGGAGDPTYFRLPMDRYRRSFLDRESERWLNTDPQNARLVVAYEQELRRQGLIDFDDMPLLALAALRRHEWLRRAILAKYPILVVDEYQDLGRALHAMVIGLCFSTGIRLFAVGDVDQSIYGFTGAHPELLQSLAERPEVESFRLRLNYRCSLRIVAASEHALGEERGYVAADGAAEGDVVFHPMPGDYAAQADYLFADILADAFERIPDLTPGQIGILYPAAWIGDAVADAAGGHGFEIIRTDSNSLYPRGSSLMRWLESCALWCCHGWRSGTPRFTALVAEGSRIFAEALGSEGDRLEYQRRLMRVLWACRDSGADLEGWLLRVRDDVLADFAHRCRTVDEDWATLSNFVLRLADGDVPAMTLGLFSGIGHGQDRINLSTLHSAKGREFELAILFGIDQGRLPRNGAADHDIIESRRLFYVGFTRAKRETHIMYSRNSPSPFVRHLLERLQN